MQKRRLSHERKVLIGWNIGVTFTGSQYFSDGNVRFNLLKWSLSGVMVEETGFREDNLMADAINVDELKAKAEQVINPDELKAKADKYAKQAQETVNSLGKELKEPKSRCQCVGHTLLWGGVIVAALAGLCAIGRWLKS